MDLYTVTMQTVPLIYIAIYLDANRATTRAINHQLSSWFNLTAALLGLIAFALSLFVIGSEQPVTIIWWTRPIVIIALSFAIAALFSRVLISLKARPGTETNR